MEVNKGDKIYLKPTQETFEEIEESDSCDIPLEMEDLDQIWVVDDIEEESNMLNISTLEDAGLHCSWVSKNNVKEIINKETNMSLNLRQKQSKYFEGMKKKAMGAGLRAIKEELVQDIPEAKEEINAIIDWGDYVDFAIRHGESSDNIISILIDYLNIYAV